MEIKVQSEGEAEHEEIMNDEVKDYPAKDAKPERATKAVKGLIRKRVKKFQHVNKVLH